ncbi:MAG: nucleotidyltransferase domain-containing protein [Oscillospiraceae bacterium]|jgi:predicted nucleotidyltransferase|nr:nucleotidyltransferase domain-containing protein [Oscillospiraceae bacterium]
MRELPEAINTMRDKIVAAVPLERLYLFGSYAYGTPHKDSDFDFFLVVPDGGMEPLEAAHQAHSALIHMPDYSPVDIMANYSSKFNALAKFPTMARKIVREGVLLYEHN